jgi:hypothetical protein
MQANVQYLPDVKQIFMLQQAEYNRFFESLDFQEVSKLAHKVGGILLRRVLCAHAETVRVRCDCTGGVCADMRRGDAARCGGWLRTGFQMSLRTRGDTRKRWGGRSSMQRSVRLQRRSRPYMHHLLPCWPRLLTPQDGSCGSEPALTHPTPVVAEGADARWHELHRRPSGIAASQRLGVGVPRVTPALTLRRQVSQPLRRVRAESGNPLAPVIRGAYSSGHGRHRCSSARGAVSSPAWARAVLSPRR